MLKKALSLLSNKERRHLGLLLVMIIIMACIEVGGVASIMPFMAVLGNPDVIHSNPLLSGVYAHFLFESEQAFLIFLGTFALGFLVFAISYSALTIWLLLRFTYLREYTISKRLFEHYLAHSYHFFLNRNSSELVKNLFTEVALVINGVYVPGIMMLARAIVALFIVSFLVFVNPVVALTAIATLGGLYSLIYLVARRHLNKIGKERLIANEKRFHVVNEALSGIKEIKLYGKEAFYQDAYIAPAERFSVNQAKGQLTTQLPKYALEAIAFGGILGITLMMLKNNIDHSEVFAILGVYAFAGYRLMPALQQVFAGATKIRFNLAALNKLHADLIENSQPTSPATANQTITFKKTIQLDNISYQYPNTTDAVLKNINLTIDANTTVGFIGGSGAGKSTLIDVIAGLFSPSAGSILLDQQKLTADSLRAWQSHIAYVPQITYIADSDIIHNIAFAVPEDEIDIERVYQAAKMAHIDEFILNELPNGYQTEVGEKGIRLSGGQRQRLGIARALYRNPRVLILDESTNALDNDTEKAIMQAIDHLKGQMTILIIAHRLSTLKEASVIHQLKNGKIIASGDYQTIVLDKAA